MPNPGSTHREQPVESSPGTDSLIERHGTLRLLQLTDTHLYADPDGRLLGQNTRRTLDLVLDLALERFWPVDLILLTGDLVHDESHAGYRYLEQRLAELDTLCHCLPGNHDQSRIMAQTLDSGTISLAPSARCGPWNLIFLDSSIPGEDGGHLDGSQLTLLDTTLAAHPQSHALICLHHQAVPVGSAWMDEMTLDNPDSLFGVIDHHPQVRGLLWGHVHQEFRTQYKDMLLLGSPSTCIQFLPHSEDFSLDVLTPGFRWLELQPDGRISTGIERVAAYPDPLVLTDSGY